MGKDVRKDVQKSYILVDTDVAPEVFFKVVEAKRVLAAGKCKTVHEALEQVDLSRSAFYKYRDHVFSHSDDGFEKMVTLSMTLEDILGVLSDILIVLASYHTNVLTINQNIPVNGVANVTISLSTDSMEAGLDILLDDLRRIAGVNRIEVLAMK